MTSLMQISSPNSKKCSIASIWIHLLLWVFPLAGPSLALAKVPESNALPSLEKLALQLRNPRWNTRLEALLSLHEHLEKFPATAESRRELVLTISRLRDPSSLVRAQALKTLALFSKSHSERVRMLYTQHALKLSRSRTLPQLALQELEKIPAVPLKRLSKKERTLWVDFLSHETHDPGEIAYQLRAMEVLHAHYPHLTHPKALGGRRKAWIQALQTP
jgi:hypothetical protein